MCLAALAVLKNGVLERTDGVAGCDTAFVPISEPVFQAASLGKPVFAYAVLKLAQQGMLDLDRPLVDYLPQGYGHVQNWNAGNSNRATDTVTAPELQAVTVRMVLLHTSGLPDWAGGPLTFQSKPGTRWNYSGEGFVLLQKAVEAATGLTLQTLMQQQVFEPLGMAHSSYAADEALVAQLAPGTLPGGKVIRPPRCCRRSPRSRS